MDLRIFRRKNIGQLLAKAPALVFLAILVAPAQAFAWGANAQRLIANRAIDTLPPEMQSFFDGNREFILRHVTDPLGWLDKTPAAERPNQILFLDRYGKFPFDDLPRAAVRRGNVEFGKGDGGLSHCRRGET